MSAEYKMDKLSASNYATWKTVVKSQLMGKDLWDFVVESKNLTDAEKISNEKAKTLMYLAMEPSQIAATGVCDSAHDLWMKIQENHEGALSNLRSTSLAEFLGLKYRKNESLVSYSGRYENSLGKLESTGHEVDDKTKLWVYANSLPQHMKLTVQMFTMANPNGKVSELISQLKIQHHMDRNDSDRQAAAYHTQEGRHETPNTKRQSSYGQSDEQRDSQSRPNSKIICRYCKKPGHVWKECRKLKADDKRKKRFGQMNQQRNERTQQLSQKRGQQLNQTEARGANFGRGPHAGGGAAFNARAHEFSEGKFTWIVDSGASSHITPYREFLVDYENFDSPHPITLGDGKKVEAHGKGNMPFVCDEFKGELKNVLWVPKIRENLFSICRTMEQECSVEFCNEDSTVYFYREKKIVLRGRKKPDQHYFLLNLRPTTQQSADECALLGASYEGWHRRLGHCSMETVKALAKSGAVDGLKIRNDQRHECNACINGKLCRSHHPERNHIEANESSAVLHIDTVGPFKTPTIGDSRYFVLATEEFSGYKLFETMNSKAMIPDAVKRIINKTELESGRPVKAILTDNGSEFTNAGLAKFITEKGIVHQFSATYTPEQNGRAERANRTAIEGIRTLLIDSGLGEEFWAEALNTFIYTNNRTSSRKNLNKTHFELFTGKRPDISNLRIFGQKAIIREADSAREGKLAPKGEEVVFVGYTNRHNTYRFFTDKPFQQIFESCDAKFISDRETANQRPEAEHTLTILDTELFKQPAKPNEAEPSEAFESASEGPSDTISYDYSDGEETDASAVSEAEQPAGREQQVEVAQAAQPERRITRALAKSQSQKTDAEGPSLVGVHVGAMFTLDNEPRTLKDAKESGEWHKWKQAMDEEIAALDKNKTWILVDRPPNVKPIKNKWVYKVKLKPDSTVERYKARLVAKGYTQIENVDYKETYAPVASMNAIRMLLAIANQESMHIVQFDIKTAFLYGDLEETLYMEQPENYVRDPNKVCKLIKSLYGLKQAPRQWNKKFDSFLKLFELQQSRVDKCIYFNDSRSLLLAIYVDDGLAAGRDRKQLDSLINHLKTNFELKSMECESYLGLEVTRDHKARTLSICQARYIDKMLNRFNMADSNVVSTPEQVGATFEESPLLPTENQFKELLGSLLYLATCTRPDISHAVSIASRTSQPTQAHWLALKRILRYLKGSRDLGIRFRWENPNELVGYSDADYANDAKTRKSTTGTCIFFGGAPIAWRCQRQPIITLSTTEAEYVAGCELVKEILPIREQLIELKQIKDQPTKILIDNQSTVRIASNESGQCRTKHIDIREKWLTEQVSNGKIEVSHISGDEQAADILTKPLYKSKFIANRSKLLTQIMMVMTIIAICAPVLSTQMDAKDFVTTDPITTTESEYAAIKGDTRYRLTNIFVNPCEHLFKYSTTIASSETLVRNCFSYYAEKHLEPLSNCKRLPDVGPSLDMVPVTYDCSDGNEKSSAGKCEVTRREFSSRIPPNHDLENTQLAWARHKQRVKDLTAQPREKRAIPLIWAAFVAITTLFSGAGVKLYVDQKTSTANIDLLANRSQLHDQVMMDATEFLDQIRTTAIELQSWSSDVEERLGSLTDDFRERLDPATRGKRAKLVKTYMQWFNQQEKLLQDINHAASMKKVPATLNKMLNITQNVRSSNMSTLFECSYKLENRSMVLTLDFLLPEVDEQIEILDVLPMDYYSFTNVSDDSTEKSEYCWQRYTGPAHIFHNKTSNCYMKLNEAAVHKRAIRSQVCLEKRNDLHYPANITDNWTRDSCSEEAPKILDRVQIIEIDGYHKIYCYPQEINIDGEKLTCPMSPFIIRAHSDYNIGNITHSGAYIHSEISRKVRSANRTIAQTRTKRSPVELPTSTNSTMTTGSTTIMPMKPEQVIGKTNITNTLKTLSEKLNISMIKLKETIKKLGAIELRNATLDTYLKAPYEVISESYNWIAESISAIGISFGIVTGVLFLIVLMPAIEVIIIGLKIIKIPADIWIGSARRVTNRLNNLQTSSPGVTSLFKKKRKRWDDTMKMV